MASTRRRNTLRRVVLNGRVGVADTAALHERLTALLSRKSKVTLDLGTTERLDTAAAQLLACFAMAASRREIPLHWGTPSPAAVEALRSVGLLGCCGLEAAADT